MHFIFPSSLILRGVERLDRDEQISGGFASVYRGRLHENQPVAIKRLHVFLQTSESAKSQAFKVIRTFCDLSYAHVSQNFCRECLIWKDLKHDHVLQLLGIAIDLFENSPCIISPWMEHGRIRDHMTRLRSNGGLQGSSFQAAVIKWVGIFRIFWGMYISGSNMSAHSMDS